MLRIYLNMDLSESNIQKYVNIGAFEEQLIYSFERYCLITDSR